MGLGISGSEHRVSDRDQQPTQWSNEMVLEWLTENGFDDYKKHFVGIDGSSLGTLTKDILVDEMNVPTGVAIKIMKILDKLNIKQSEANQSNQTENEEVMIKNCLMKLSKLKGLQNLTEKQKRDKAKNLVIKQHLLNSYLNKDFVATKQTITELIHDGENSVGEDSQPSTIGSIIPKSEAVNMGASIEGNNMDDEDKRDLEQLAKEISDLQTNKNFMIKDEEFLKVKLVIVELHRTSAQRNFRKFLSPVLDTFNIVPQFGLFHSALVVGPWYLEWNDSSLIVPRKCYSGAAVLAADVDRCFHGPQVGEALDKISSVISEWNSNMTYSQQKANCQHFVDDICRVLGLELKFKGALGEYCERLRTFGSCELNYSIPKELKEKCGFSKDTFKFETHLELDNFVHEILKKDPMYFERGKQDDWMLLKSFDRAFWLRYFKNKKSEAFKPCTEGCPFSDPTQSGSILENFFTYSSGKKR